MRTEEEIQDRLVKLETFLEISPELGQLPNKMQLSNMRKEIRVLNWVLGEQEIKKTHNAIETARDQIINL